MLNRLLPVRRNRLRQELERVEREIERAFDDPWSLLEFTPALDLEEHDDHYTLKVDVPGLGKDDIEVYLQGDTLVIEGERREEVKRRRRIAEVYYGRIYRAVPLPGDANPDGITTRLRRGVLEVTIPRQKTPRNRIEVREVD